MSLGWKADPETQAQLSQWKSMSPAGPKKAKQVKNKVMLTFLLLQSSASRILQKPKLLTYSIIKRFPVIFMKQFGARDQTCWQTHNWQLNHDNSPTQFFESEPGFHGQAQHSSGSSDCLLFKHDSLWSLDVSQVEWCWKCPNLRSKRT